MPRQPRYFLPGIPQHVVTRGVDRQAVFFQRRDYELYLDSLGKAATEYGCQIHAYALMTNHVHLLLTAEKERSLPNLMQAMGRHYVQRLNYRYARSGTLWEGRYRASPVQTDRYLLACQRYIELNPVRAAIVTSPGDYPYSSFRHYALGYPNPLVTPHKIYLGLHSDPRARCHAYRGLFRETLSEELLARFRRNTNSCTVIGGKEFKMQIAAMLGREMPTGKRGRPRKKRQDS